METSPIIAELDPPRNIIHGGLAADVGSPVDELIFQRPVHRFRQSIIIAYPGPADGLLDAEFLKFIGELA
jgi:hypothetical protein